MVPRDSKTNKTGQIRYRGRLPTWYADPFVKNTVALIGECFRKRNGLKVTHASTIPRTGLTTEKKESIIQVYIMQCNVRVYSLPQI